MGEIEPFELFETDDDFRLVLSEEHLSRVMDVFDEHGRYGSGHNWEAVARQALRVHAPEHVGLISYEPDVTTFVAISYDYDALRQLAELLARAFHDHLFLERLLRDAEEDWFD